MAVLQLLSMPSQTSFAFGFMVSLVSKQSVLSATKPLGWSQASVVLFGSPKPSLSLSLYQVAASTAVFSSVMVSQLLSMPSQISSAFGLMAMFVSQLSVLSATKPLGWSQASVMLV